MITKQDSLKLQRDFEKDFVTKEEFHEFKSEMYGFKEEFRTFKNDFYDRIDIVIGELKAMREEVTIFAYRQSDIL